MNTCIYIWYAQWRMCVSEHMYIYMVCAMAILKYVFLRILEEHWYFVQREKLCCFGIGLDIKNLSCELDV